MGLKQTTSDKNNDHNKTVISFNLFLLKARADDLNPSRSKLNFLFPNIINLINFFFK